MGIFHSTNTRFTYEEEEEDEEEEESKIKHYSSRHRILLVGEGDFSFSACLAVAFGDATNIIATSLDTEAILKKHYGKAMSNIAKLRSRGGNVLHGIDATRMATRPDFQCKKFHRIIYNFPHAGFHGNEDNPDVMKKHRDLVLGFLQNARRMLHFDGEIHVSHKTGAPFDSWKIEDMASECSLVCFAQDRFNIKDYPGYNNKRGSGCRADEAFPLGACKTYRFRLCPAALNNAHFMPQTFMPRAGVHQQTPTAPFASRI